MKTRNGIYNNPKESPYQYRFMGFVFYFTSKLHLDKFKNRLEEKTEDLEESLKKRFKITVYAPQLSAVILYHKIETRNKYFTYRGRAEKWHTLVLNGEIQTKMSYRELTKTQEQN